MINVHPDNDDPFYRYKMPKLLAKIEGCGNGIKTVIVNMSSIAKALNRAPEYSTKFFGCELGAQVQMNSREDRWIINGAHDNAKLQSLLGVFIKKFVLCENCENPETVLAVSKNDISQKCKACGHVTKPPIGHRLCNYIMSHTPKMLSETKSGGGGSGGGSKKRGGKKTGARESPSSVPTSTIESELTAAATTEEDLVIRAPNLRDDDRQWTGGGVKICN
ncbi:hypothetical protein ACOME3_002965 [Neoechinorhynchus agilis]